MKNRPWKKIVLLTASIMLISPVVLAAGVMDTSEANASASIRLQDDLYAAVNEQWLASAKIPAGKIAVGGLEDLGGDIEDRLMADFATITPKSPNAEKLSEFLKFYDRTLDYEKRNKDGAAPLRPYLKVIDKLQNLKDFNKALPELVLKGSSLPQLPPFLVQMASPFTIIAVQDMKNAQYNSLQLEMPNVILNDASLYDTPAGRKRLASYKEHLLKLLKLSGCKPKKAAQIADQTLAFDRVLQAYAPSLTEKLASQSVYNPVLLKDLAASSKSVDIKALISALVPKSPTTVVLRNPRFYNSLDKIFNEKNFPLLKGWLYGQTVFGSALALTEEMANTAESYNMSVLGSTELTDPKKLAYRLASAPFDQLVGEYYGRTYLREDAKHKLTDMAENIRSEYIRRLQANDWLSKETIKMAVTKVKAMKMHIGYPDYISPFYSELHVKDGNLLDNYVSLLRVHSIDFLKRCGQKVNRDEWYFPAHVANAAHYLQGNAVFIAAGILGEPVYSPKYSLSRLYGSIGAVIAHEITHGFDTNGARYDQYGGLRDWWTKADYKAYQERTASMVTLFDGLPSGGGKVDGKLTANENVSDAGGLSSTFELVKKLPGGNLKEFFEGWATLWRFKATPETVQYLLTSDPHAPYKLRVNRQVQNLYGFYDVYDVHEGDGMYLAPEKRVKVW
ncbi:M13 family metallopeptidase [Paenibacillus sp. MMS20-IR301]|uniref:M13 family metallopeptidase n=1 Tax=Paenibacillus sp. MMS20-IR301 TaxID=2895946 RepID=UPI0028E968DA|nr:M13 family metallopeptidase [Paenibacillus sp. MMS20-IR301]WNS45197.1 M13 family metallopeptidase [Paenibacillus sp. MMS20-IR301]